MKAYILTEEDFSNLLEKIDRDPNHGDNGGSSRVFTEDERRAHEEAHRRFNYWGRIWIDKVKK